MNQYKAIFKLNKYEESIAPESKFVTIEVEGGNMRMASMRAIAKISGMKEYADYYKTLMSIEQINGG